MTFADQLRKHRARLRINQTQLAALLDVSLECISKWERELTAPSAITQEGALARLKKAKGKP